MLMFGDEYNMVRHFPEYFLDYREMLDPSIRWTDRLQSSSGEWAGSGVPNIFNTWEDQGWTEPVIEEQFDPDRTILTLTFDKKQAKKTDDIAEHIELSLPRTRVILKEMDDIEAIGGNTNRRYR